MCGDPNEISEGEALSDNLEGYENRYWEDLLNCGYDWDDPDDKYYEILEYKSQQKHKDLSPKYRKAKDAKVGQMIECPVCGKSFKKKSYQQAFCRNKGRGNCKDKYHNSTDPIRLERAKVWKKS